MKSSNSTIRYASKQDYLNRRPTKVSSALKDKGAEVVENTAKKAPQNPTALQDKDLSQVGKDIKDKVQSKVAETGSAGKHLLGQAGGSLVRGLASVVSPSLPSIGVEIPAGEKGSASAQEVVQSDSKRVDKPGIFFVKGFSFNPFEAENEGLGEMSGNIPYSEVFNWDGKEDIIEAVKSRPHGQPIILVGHGMGGDTIVDVANELNRVEHGFRNIDLLVTLDSIGSDNDIIPQNVKENFNLISDQDNFFNDGPNVARKKEMTFVSNELRTENHNELESSPEVQFLVYEKINQTLMRAVAKKNFSKQLDQNFRERMMNSHQLNFNPSSAHLKQLLN